jgi:hypothetical protein
MDNYIISDDEIINELDIPMSDEEIEAWLDEQELLSALECEELTDILEIVDDDDYQSDIDISELV